MRQALAVFFLKPKPRVGIGLPAVCRTMMRSAFSRFVLQPVIGLSAATIPAAASIVSGRPVAISCVRCSASSYHCRPCSKSAAVARFHALRMLRRYAASVSIGQNLVADLERAHEATLAAKVKLGLSVRVRQAVDVGAVACALRGGLIGSGADGVVRAHDARSSYHAL